MYRAKNESPNGEKDDPGCYILPSIDMQLLRSKGCCRQAIFSNKNSNQMKRIMQVTADTY
jgi:hypothetical protein